MKKLFAISVLFAVLGLLVLPAVANAQYGVVAKDSCILKHSITIGTESPAKGAIVGPPGGTRVTFPTNTWGLFCVLDSVFTVIDWVFYVLVVISMALILIGAILFVTATGDPEKSGKGKTFIIYGIIGIVICAFAKAIPSIIIAVLGL